MRIVVTGAAGFIGSRLVELLLDAGEDVVGIDAFTPYYERSLKEANAAGWRASGRPLLELDLRHDDLREAFAGAEVVHHLAAQPGVRASWGSFADYAGHNLVATQRVLEAAAATGVRRVVVASSSSVYGNAASYPTVEDDPLVPHSPYGVTKRAVEDLCRAHADTWGTDTVLLRYFTVYGPRQRPDMAFHRICEAALDATAFPLYGDGSARRDFTYVDDAVRAAVAAGTAEVEPATPINVAGGDEASMREVFDLVSELVGEPLRLDPHPPQPGDVARTGGCTDRAARILGYEPSVTLREGLERQLAWHRSRRAACPG